MTIHEKLILKISMMRKINVFSIIDGFFFIRENIVTTSQATKKRQIPYKPPKDFSFSIGCL